MIRLLQLISKDFRRKWRSPAVILGFMLIPVVFTLIFGFVFGPADQAPRPKLKMFVADNDDSVLSRFFISSLTQGDLSQIIHTEPVEEDRGRELMDRGKASALLIIPKGFGQKIWQGQETDLLLLKNPSERFLPQIAEEIVDTASLVLSGLVSVFDDEISRIRKAVDADAFSDEDVSSVSVLIKNKIESFSKYVFPPPVSLKEQTLQEEGEKEPEEMRVEGYILPAVAIMFLLFICNVVFEDILRERDLGTLMRMQLSPLLLSEFIWSKIITSVLIGMISMAVLVAVGRVLFSIHWGNLWGLLVIIFSISLLIAGFIAFLYAFIRTERQAGALLSSVFIVISLLGGSMMPVENFPPFLQKTARFTLNYWGIKAFHKNILHDPFREILPLVAGMAAAGLILSAVGALILKRNLRRRPVK